MAITVAPLTTVVINSVAQEHAGTASGINNAVARLAGVLAISVFGIVMVKVFDTGLDHRLTSRNLPANIVQYLRSREIELASLEPPQGVDANTVAGIRQAISRKFNLRISCGSSLLRGTIDRERSNCVEAP